MSSVAVQRSTTPAEELVELRPGYPVPRIYYTTVPGSGEPFFEDDLNMGALPPHSDAILFLGPIFQEIARRLGWWYLSDNPVTYVKVETGEPVTLFPDLALTPCPDRQRLVASDLKLVLEVVSTQEQRIFNRDRKYKRFMNDFGGVPEFLLYYPDVDDLAPLQLYRRVGAEADEYVNVLPERDGVFTSQSVPGLTFRRLPQAEQRSGVRIEVRLNGERLGTYAEERQRAEQERQRAERLAEKLRALGLDPESDDQS